MLADDHRIVAEGPRSLVEADSAAATGAAYSAGVAAGATAGGAPVAVAVPASGTRVMGMNNATLPGGCITPNVGGGTHYLCGDNWFQPSCGANGVYYRVVPAP